MTKGKALDRLRRLESIKGLLRADEFATVQALAERLGVSARSVSRDLQLLRHSGVPIEADRGRGGGLRLQRHWSLGHMQLSAEEAIDLLLALALAAQLQSPLLLRQIGGIERKISAAFADTHLGKVRQLRKRILIGQPASPAVLATLTPQANPSATWAAPQPLPKTGTRTAWADITKAFFHQQCLEIRYRDQSGTVTTRVVETQFLYYNQPVWYLLAWDQWRQDIRFFRTDRIQSARCLPQAFRLAHPKPYLALAETMIQTL